MSDLKPLAEQSGYHVGTIIDRIQGGVEGAVGAIQDNTLAHLMRQWSVVEALQIGRENPEDVRRYYYCADRDCGRYIDKHHSAKVFADKCKAEGREITHAWSYIEIDGTKAAHAVNSLKNKAILSEQLASLSKERARVVVARGLVVSSSKSNSGMGVPIFGEIAVGLMSRTSHAHDFTYLIGASLNLESDTRFYIEDKLDESNWVSRAQAVKFRGMTVDILDGHLK